MSISIQNWNPNWNRSKNTSSNRRRLATAFISKYRPNGLFVWSYDARINFRVLRVLANWVALNCRIDNAVIDCPIQLWIWRLLMQLRQQLARRPLLLTYRPVRTTLRLMYTSCIMRTTTGRVKQQMQSVCDTARPIASFSVKPQQRVRLGGRSWSPGLSGILMALTFVEFVGQRNEPDPIVRKRYIQVYFAIQTAASRSISVGRLMSIHQFYQMHL